MSKRKKIVVIVPSGERKVLSQVGILPADCFQALSSEELIGQDIPDRVLPLVYLWPYDIRYTGSNEYVENVSFQPVDVPAFFGLGKAETEEQKRRNECKIEELLGSVVVHVAFLDNKTTPDGYAKLNTFSEIVEWSSNLQKAIDYRFHDERALKTSNHILVLISRVGQIYTNASEVARFQSCIGENSIFKSCYFMDYNLFVGETERIFHSADVWPVMVSRLILAFMLNQEQGHLSPCWTNPGIKVWTAKECSIAVEEADGVEVLNLAFNEAMHLLQNTDTEDPNQEKYLELLGEKPAFYNRKAEDIGILLPEAAPETISNVNEFQKWVFSSEQPEWRKVGPTGWANFKAKSCANTTASDAIWQKGLNILRKKYFTWKLNNTPQDYTRSVNGLFNEVKNSTLPLFARMNELFARIVQMKNCRSNSSEELAKLARIEIKRKKEIETLQLDSVEMDKASAHYVGYGLGLLCLAIVALLFGWIMYRLRTLTGIDITTVLSFFGAFVGGGFLAVILLMSLHSHFGKIGVDDIIRHSEDIDKQMVERDAKAREILIQGKILRDELQLRSARFHIWSLMQRVKTILVTEMQPEDAELSRAVGANRDEQADDIISSAIGSRSRQFQNITRTIIGPYKVAMGAQMQTNIKNIVRTWILGDGVYRKETQGLCFRNLWRNLCATDRECRGYYPARLFINGIDFFVQRFMTGFMNVIQESIAQNHASDIRDAVEKWCEAIQWAQFAHFATATVNGEIVNARLQLSPILFLNGEHQAVTSLEKSDIAIPDCSLRKSSLLNQLSLLAFFYQEFCIDLTIHDLPESGIQENGETYGILSFKEANDAQY